MWGPQPLVGNLEGADSLITVDSFIDFRNSADAANGQYGLNRDTLVYFNIDPIRPERVRTFEIGYRTTLGEKVYLDGGYYFSVYQDFIGYNIGLDALFIGDEQSPRAVDVYRYAANSINEVQTQGASIGLNYYIDNQFMLSGNYSWNELVKTDEDDPIIPAFNTPKHKYNLGITARDLKLKGKSTWGFGVNYKWIQGFLFEGSPQFTGSFRRMICSMHKSILSSSPGTRPSRWEDRICFKTFTSRRTGAICRAHALRQPGLRVQSRERPRRTPPRAKAVISDANSVARRTLNSCF